MKKAYCPICDKTQECEKTLVNVKHGKDKFALVFCNCCHMCFQYPRISSEKIKEYYSSGYNLSNYENDLEKTFQTMKRLAEFRFSFICQKIGSVPKFCLEIGPGVGTLMSIFQKSGSVAVGVEADTIAAEWMKREKNLNIYNLFFDEFIQSNIHKKYLGKCDLVIMSHVLEHIPRPIEMLREVKCLMEPKNAYLFIEVPNVLRPYSDGKRWQDHCDLGHIYYYSPATLKYLLENCGYRVESMLTDAVPPHFPIFCLAKNKSAATESCTELNVRNDIRQIRKAWFRLRINHYVYYYPRRVLGAYLRQVNRPNHKKYSF